MLLGTIGSRYFLRKNIPVLETFKYSKGVPTVYDAKDISDYILTQYNLGMIDEFYIVFTHMYSSVKLVPEVLKILPLDEKLFDLESEPGKAVKTDSSMTYIPSPQAVLDALIPKYLSGEVFGTMVENTRANIARVWLRWTMQQRTRRKCWTSSAFPITGSDSRLSHRKLPRSLRVPQHSMYRNRGENNGK